MKRHWMGGSRSQLQSSKSNRETTQREFFLQRRNSVQEASGPNTIDEDIELCQEASTVAEMAHILRSKDLQLLASLSSSSSSTFQPLRVIVHPVPVHAAPHPVIFTSAPHAHPTNPASEESTFSSTELESTASQDGASLDESTPLDILYRVANCETVSPQPSPEIEATTVRPLFELLASSEPEPLHILPMFSRYQ